MASNNTTQATSATISTASLAVAYYALTLVVVGTSLNIFTFIILCRSSFSNAKARPILYYMRAMAIFDIFMLYGWNIDHYLVIMHRFAIQRLTIPSCRFLSFLNFFAAQSSAWLRVFVCLDRYLSLSRLHKTWFSKAKSVFIIIGCIMIILTLLNLHILILPCYYKEDGTISVFSLTYEIYPMWDYVNLGVYNCVPFLLMVTFNSGVIYHLIRLKYTSTVQNSRIQHRAISITLVITTFLFLAMTIPATVSFAFFVDVAYPAILKFMDGLMYTYHILSFPLYMITFDEFRNEVCNLITCNRYNRRVAPLTGTGTAPQTLPTGRTNVTN